MSAVRPTTKTEVVMAGAVAKMIVTVLTMFKNTLLQRLLISVGVVGGLIGAYLGMVQLLLLDSEIAQDPVEAWIVSVFLTPCILGIVGGGMYLALCGLRTWWEWMTEDD